MRVCASLAALLGAAALCGCGLSLGAPGPRRPPSSARTATTARAAASAHPAVAAAHPALAAPPSLRSAVARAQRTHELPTPRPPQTAPGGWRSPVQAVQVFAENYINWTAATVAAHLRALAAAAVGQAHSAMVLASAQVRRDSDLQRGGIANAGTVEAIAPVTGQGNVYAVVTRERTTATNTSAYRGLQPSWHVTLATVVKVFGRLWTISGWQPES